MDSDIFLYKVSYTINEFCKNRVISHFYKPIEDIDLFLGKDIQTTFEGITQQYFNTFSFDVLKMIK